MTDELAPVVLFCYKRPDCLRQVLDALKQNHLAEKTRLIIFSDGPKSPADEVNVSVVREIIRCVDGFLDVELFESVSNRGLAESVISGVTEVVNRFGKVIVLEDDLVVSPWFLQYMNDALDLYENDDAVAGIQGYLPPGIETGRSSFFIREVGCWGWATWKRGWDLFESDGGKLLAEIKRRKLEYVFDVYGSFPYVKMLSDQSQGRVDSWAIRWYASVFLAGKLGLQPGKNLVSNIGYDQGTHFSGGRGIVREEVCDHRLELCREELIVSEDLLENGYAPYNRTFAIPLWKKAVHKLQKLAKSLKR